MDKKQLSNVKYIDAVISSKSQELRRIEILEKKIDIVIGKKVECKVKIAEYRKQLEADICQKTKEKADVLNAIQQCEEDSFKLLYMRYFEYKEWEEIAETMNYSFNWVVQGLHDKAIKQLQKVAPY